MKPLRLPRTCGSLQRAAAKCATAAATASLLGGLFLLLGRHSQQVNLNFDEHQFVAAGALLARRGLWPFIDYAFYHLPNLPLIYGLVFLFTDELLASARWVSAAGAWVCMAVVVMAAMGRLRFSPGPVRLLIAAGLAGMMMATPLFALSSGKAWNQDVPLAGAMLALAALWRAAASRRRPGTWGIVCGLLLGLAIGARVTYAPLLLGFLLLMPLMPRPKDARLMVMAGFLAGVAVALGPTVVVWIAQPEAFWYGVVEFPLVNLQADRHDPVLARLYPVTIRALDLHDKPEMLAHWVSHRPTLVIAAAASMLVLPAVVLAVRRGPGSFAMRSAAATTALIALGAVVPQPLYPHYLYPIVPVLTLTMVIGAQLLRRRLPRAARRAPAFALAAAGASCVALGATFLGGMIDAAVHPQPTVPQALRQSAQELALTTDADAILTLTPMLALEIGRDIHPGTVAGPLPFRAAALVPPPRRRQVAMLGGHNLDDALAAAAPPAILTGTTVLPAWEQPLVDYAKAHHYRPQPLSGRRVLWHPPPAPPSRAVAAAAPALP